MNLSIASSGLGHPPYLPVTRLITRASGTIC
jgi:hypothetical protein